MNWLVEKMRAIQRLRWSANPGRSLYLRTRAATVAICLRDSGGGLLPFGSGVNVDPRGLVVTCKHVIEAAQVQRTPKGAPPSLPKAATGVIDVDLAVYDIVAVFTFMKGGELELGIARPHSMYGEHKVDLAVMLLRPDEALPYVSLLDSDQVCEGESVFASGFPFGPDLQPGSPIAPLFQRGIIAGVRPHDLHPRRTRLLVDMSINPGNSGGPLCSESSGGVVGIIYAQHLRSEKVPSGIGLAVPSNRARELVRLARDDGKGGLEIHREELLGKGGE